MRPNRGLAVDTEAAVLAARRPATAPIAEFPFLAVMSGSSGIRLQALPMLTGERNVQEAPRFVLVTDVQRPNGLPGAVLQCPQNVGPPRANRARCRRHLRPDP